MNLRLLLAAAVTACGLVVTAASAADSRPNIIVILADDVGYSDIGCFGGEIKTPNLDALAADGVRFTQFYNTARCCPTRASLLTGLYPHQAGVGYMVDRAAYSATAMINEWYLGDLRQDTATLGEAMRANGYSTYAVGKWHVTKNQEPDKPHDSWPLQRGFDHYYGVIPGAANYWAPVHLTRDNTRIDYKNDPEYKPAEFYLTDAFTDHAVRYVTEHAKQDPSKPFFMYLAYTAAHWPLQAKPADIAKYHGKYDVGYGPIRAARYERMKQLGLIKPDWPMSPQFGDWDKVQRKDWEARCMEVYAAQIDCMDQGVGRLVAALRANGQYDNTLIIYLQDNGACAEEINRNANPGSGKAKKKKAGAGGLPPMPGPENTWLSYGEGWANVSDTPYRLYKHYTHEGGISTPLIAHWPRGISRHGDLENQPGHLIDIMATCVDLGGGKYPAEHAGLPVQPMEGRSLVPAFAGKPIQRDALFWEHESNRALRMGDWKLVAKGADGPWELYNMQSDRTEMHDLASAQPERVQSMVAVWNRWAERTHAIPWPWKPQYPTVKEQAK